MIIEPHQCNNQSNQRIGQPLKSNLEQKSDGKIYISCGQSSMGNLDYASFDIIPQPICITARDGAIKYVNRCWLETMIFLGDNAINSQIFDFIHPQDRQEIGNFCSNNNDGDRSHRSFSQELRIRFADNEYYWFLVHGQPHLANQATTGEWIFTWTNIDKYYRTQQELEQQSEFLNALLTNLSDGIVACDRNGNLTLFNRAAMKFHGLGVKNIPPQQWSEHYDLYLADGKTPMHQSEIPLFRALQGESVRNLEMTIVPKWGKTRHLIASGDAIVNAAGENLGAVVAMRDITEQKEALTELRDRDGLLSSIYNGTEVIIFVIDVCEDGSFRYVGLNPAYERFTGVSLLQVEGKTPAEIFSPELASNIQQRYANCLHTGEITSYEENFVINDENTWWLTTLTPLYTQNQQKIHRIIGTSINITNRKKAEAEVARLNQNLEVRVEQRTQELRVSEERFRATFEQAAVGFAHVGLDGKWLRVNQKLCEIVGYSRDELLNLTFQDITHPEDLEADLDRVNQLLNGEIEYYSMEKRYIRKDGSTIWAEITPNLMHSDSNQPIYFIVVVEDIQERKQAESKIQQKIDELAQTNFMLAQTTAQLSKSNQELDQFAYVASHDLKAPLRAIANLSQWLEEDLSGTLPEENQQQLELLRGRVYRMEGLIDGLLAYSRVGRKQQSCQQVDVNDLLIEVIDSLDPPSGFKIEITSPMPILTTQKLLLSQVFSNLIGNAIHHHPHEEGHISISAEEQGNFYEFVITDDGLGIAPEYHQKIFAIFQTLQPRDQKESTGMGLSIVKKILETRGGKIHVESQVGQGASFYFQWPKNSE